MLDEATSALDPADETHIYRQLNERLPQTAIVSVAHRESPVMFHPHALDLERADEREAA